MSWWGKIIGGTLGFVVGGPLGALLMGALGHNLDRGIEGLERDENAGVWNKSTWNKERTQSAFFTATFSVMGHIAKADGLVSRDEISMANHLMGSMDLTEEHRKVAMDLFAQGKAADFPFEAIMEQFRQECSRNRNLMQMFVEMQLYAAYADGHVHPKERVVLQRICSKLGYTAMDFQQLEQRVQAQFQFSGTGSARHASSQLSIDDAYKLLGLESSADDAQVKKAYRRMMNQHHPDKLAAKGLPEEMMKVATEKTQEIKAAYERIKKSREDLSL